MKTLLLKSGLRFIGHRVFSILPLFFFSYSAIAQLQDSLIKPAKSYKNSVKLNISAPVLYDNAVILSYERIINKNQSLNFFAGVANLGGLKLASEDFIFGDELTRKGYTVGADYRFYLSKENKDPIPHGIYLAPFFSYYKFENKKELTYTGGTDPETISTQLNVNFYNIGGELGYQFVLGKRFVIDVVMFGPAFTKYTFDAKLGGQFSGISEDEALYELIQALKDKFPLLEELSEGGEVSGSGSQKFWGAGFRYNINIGFRF